MIKSFTPDQICSVLFSENVSGAPVPICSNHANGERTSKIILPKLEPGARIPQPGQTWQCRFDRDTKPNSNFGAFVFIPLTEELDSGFPDVWLPDEDAKKITIGLETPGINICLQGPHGCGKTHIGHGIAKKYRWPLVQIDCAQIPTSKTLFGHFVPCDHLPGKAQASWEYSALAKLLKAAAKKPKEKFFGLLDELGRMDGTAHSATLPITYPGPNAIVRIPQTGDEIRLHGNIQWISTQNVGPGFNPQGDAASADRYMHINVGYMPDEIEVQHCLVKFPGAPRTEIERAVKIINVLRQRFLSPESFADKNSISKPVSTRSTEQLTALVRGGISLESAFETAVAHMYKGTVKYNGSEAWRIQEIVKKELGV